MTTRARDFYEARRAEPVPRHQGELAPPARGGNCAIAGRGQQPLHEGLPVWRVKSYGNISYEEVEKQHARFHGPGTNWDFGRLYTDFWLREFTNAADEIKNSSRSRRNSADAREEAAGLGGGLWPGAGAV